MTCFSLALCYDAFLQRHKSCRFVAKRKQITSRKREKWLLDYALNAQYQTSIANVFYSINRY
jgi:hypothetical protein